MDILDRPRTDLVSDLELWLTSQPSPEVPVTWLDCCDRVGTVSDAAHLAALVASCSPDARSWLHVRRGPREAQVLACVDRPELRLATELGYGGSITDRVREAYADGGDSPRLISGSVRRWMAPVQQSTELLPSAVATEAMWAWLHARPLPDGLTTRWLSDDEYAWRRG